MLAFGASLNHWTVRRQPVLPHARVVQVDLEEEAIGRSIAPTSASSGTRQELPGHRR